MKLWLYIYTQADAALLMRLKKKGVTGVIGGTALAEPAGEAGLDVMLCGGAFPAGSFAGEEHLALDIAGKRQVWFGSACPNHPGVREKNLEMYREWVKVPGISGIMIDGARFASPASSAETGAFFTCFCPHCLDKMRKLGFDPEKIRAAVDGVYGFLTKGEPLSIDDDGIADWLRFRRLCAGEHLRDFADIVHGVAGLKAGAFLFTPALASLVGQNYSDLGGQLDILAPMLYPAWPLKNGDLGPACLNGELASLHRILTEHGAVSEDRSLEILSDIMGYALPASFAESVHSDLVGHETGAAIREGRGSAILPTLQLDDPKLADSMVSALQNGAQEVAFFAYKPELEDAIDLAADVARS